MASDFEIMNETGIKDAIKSGVSGGYFFFGEEDYLKSFYAAELVKSVTDSPDGFGEFNHVVLNTDSFDASALEGALSSLPMMSEKKMVEMRSPDISSWKEKEKAEFLDIISRLPIYSHSVFLVTVNKDCFDEGNPPKKPSAMLKSIAKYMTPVEFSLQGEAKLIKWLERRFAQCELMLPREVSAFILEYCGRDMRNLSGEADKLAAYALSHGMTELTRETVELVASPAQSEDAFELANAVIAGDRRRALAALLRHKQRKEEPIAVLASVSRTMCELLEASVILESGGDKKEIASALHIHEFRAELYRKAVTGVESDRLRAAVDRCRKTDVLLKSTTLGYIALERLIATIPQFSRIRK